MRTRIGKLIKLAGVVGTRAKAVVLLDCGADGNFVSKSFARSIGLQVGELPVRVCLADGHTTQSEGIVESVRLRIASYEERLDLIVTDLQGYDVILGMAWLEEYNPGVDWRDKTVYFTDKQKVEHVLTSIPTGPAIYDPKIAQRALTSSGLNLITSKQLERHHRHGEIAFACIVHMQVSSSDSVGGSLVTDKSRILSADRTLAHTELASPTDELRSNSSLCGHHPLRSALTRRTSTVESGPVDVCRHAVHTVGSLGRSEGELLTTRIPPTKSKVTFGELVHGPNMKPQLLKYHCDVEELGPVGRSVTAESAGTLGVRGADCSSMHDAASVTTVRSCPLDPPTTPAMNPRSTALGGSYVSSARIRCQNGRSCSGARDTAST